MVDTISSAESEARRQFKSSLNKTKQFPTFNYKFYKFFKKKEKEKVYTDFLDMYNNKLFKCFTLLSTVIRGTKGARTQVHLCVYIYCLFHAPTCST